MSIPESVATEPTGRPSGSPTVDDLNKVLSVVQTLSLRVDGGRTWDAIRAALDPGGAADDFAARLRIIERDLVRVLSVVCTPAPTPTYLGNGLLFVPTSMGLPLIAFADDLQITPSLLMKRQWDTPTTHLLERVLRPGDRFLDIGANIGYFTVFAAAQVGIDGHVDAFEPNPRTHDLLARNVRLNNVGHVCTLHPRALADRPGTRMLQTFRRNQGGSTLATLPQRLLDEFQEQPTAEEITSTTLDEAFAGRDTVFSCIKMDAEGSEAMIWAGGEAFFDRHVDHRTLILLEWNPPALVGAGADRAALFATFARHGFAVWHRDDALKATRVARVEELDDWRLTELILARDAARVAAVCR